MTAKRSHSRPTQKYGCFAVHCYSVILLVASNSTVEHGLAASERKSGSPINNKHFNNHDTTFEIHVSL